MLALTAHRSCTRRRSLWLTAGFALTLTAALAAPADAVERCRVRVVRADGTILLYGSNVSGTLRWGAKLGEENNPVANAAECINTRGRAGKCTLAPEGDPGRTTPPGGCVIYFADDGPDTCAAEVRGCLPIPPPLPCSVLPANNIWNTDISALPVHPMSATYVDSIGPDARFHPDFGSGLWKGGYIGLPYIVVTSIQPLVPLEFLYWDESDPGPYPIPPLVPIEGGRRLSHGRSDRHILAVDADTCLLYEVFDARSKRRGQSWRGGSGAVWDLSSNALRPDTWTSADAAGLPILPGLVRYDEVEAGEIAHALRFSVPRTQRAYVWPARHYASSSTDPALPPMGLRARLKSTFDISGFSTKNQVILTALKQYGMIIADNGSAWYLTGTSDPRWDNEELGELKSLHGSDFEFVDASSLMVDPDSGEAQ